VLNIVMNVFVPMLYAGYSVTSQTVSDLFAIGAPTRSLWVALGALYALLVVAFGIGVPAGALTGGDATRLPANLPTPWVGMWERISVAAFMVWLIVFAVSLLRREAARARRG
jgi:hypothetical protein